MAASLVAVGYVLALTESEEVRREHAGIELSELVLSMVS
jgi:hypothetical protein